LGYSVFAVSISATAASFDCSKAHSTNEKLICGDPDLSSSDDALARAYRAAREQTPDKAKFKKESDAAWVWRESHCSDKSCLAAWYADRISTYSPAPGAPSPQQSPPSEGAELVLYYETVDYSVMVCKTARESMVANLISHGAAIGDSQAQGEWLEKEKQSKACFALAPGRKFVTSSATPVYMRSMNNVMWAVQLLPPGDTKNPLGFAPLNEIRFIPIPTL
jgi:uncharacterized protein YecT (DUF1311 family)